MSFRGVLIGVVLVAIVLGGGLVWSAKDDLSTLLDRKRAADEKATCAALDEQERADLLGVETPVTLLEAEGALDPYSCRWSTRDYKTSIAWVQAVSAPADTWATEVARQLPNQPPSGDPARDRELRKAAAQPFATADDGCRFATVLFGSERSVAPTTTSNGAPMMVAQSCVNGTYTAVMVAMTGLSLDEQLARKTRRALKVVEERLG